jgi:ABC-type uncharacterized transport system ATPase subunit
VLDGSLDDIQRQHGQNVIRVRTSGGAAALIGLPGLASVADAGNYQDLTLTGDPQAFLQQLVQTTAVQQFEIRQPSLHDIFVRIAHPTAEELRAEAGAA